MTTTKITQPQLLTFTYKTLYCYFMDLSSPFINQRLTKLCPPKLFRLWNLELFITKQITTNQVAALAGYFLQRKLQLLQNWNVSCYKLHYAALAQQIASWCKEGKFCIKSTFRNFWHVLSGSGWPGSATVPRWPLVHSTKRKSRRVQVWSKKRAAALFHPLTVSEAVANQLAAPEEGWGLCYRCAAFWLFFAFFSNFFSSLIKNAKSNNWMNLISKCFLTTIVHLNASAIKLIPQAKRWFHTQILLKMEQ